jgi:TolB-like protein
MNVRLLKPFLIQISVLIAFTGACLYADIYPNAGTTSAAFLKLGIGSRAIGMGEAFGAVANDMTALYWNPAGLAQLEQNELNITHNNSFDSINQDFVGYAKVYEKYSIAAAIYGITMPSDLERRSGLDESNPFEPYSSPEGYFGAHDLAVHFAYGRYIRPDLAVGAGVKLIQQTIDTLSAYGVAADAGALYKMHNIPLSLAFVIQNVGTPIKFVDTGYYPPFNVKLASAYRINKYVLAALDLNKPIDNYLFVSAGGEITPINFLAIRLGYKYLTEGDQTNSLSGPSAGLGVNFEISGYKFRADYAFAPYGVLGDSQRFSLTVFFGKHLRQSKIETPDIAQATTSAKQTGTKPLLPQSEKNNYSYFGSTVTTNIVSKSIRGVICSVKIACPDSDLYSVVCTAKSFPQGELSVKFIEKPGKGKVYKHFDFDRSIPVRFSGPKCDIKIPDSVKDPIIKTGSGKIISLSPVKIENDFRYYTFTMEYLEPFSVKTRDDLEDNPNPVETAGEYIRQGSDALKFGDCDTAIVRLNEALKIDPKNEKAESILKEAKEKQQLKRTGIKIAVAEFASNDTSASDAATVSDNIRNELGKTNKFNVTERNRMNVLLNGNNFQAAGCNDESCAPKMGKILKVNKVVIGTLSKSQESMFVAVNVVDVETGKIEFSEKAQGVTTKQLLDSCENIAKSIADHYKK